MRNIEKVALRRLGAAIMAFLVAIVAVLGLSRPPTIAVAAATSLSIDGLARGGTLVVPPCLPTNDPSSVQFSFTMRGAGYTTDQTVTVIGQSSTGDRYGPFVRVVKADGTFVIVVANFWITDRQTIQLTAADSVDPAATFLFIAVPSDATGGTLPPWTPQPDLEPTATPLQADTYTDSDIVLNGQTILATTVPTRAATATLTPRPTERPALTVTPIRTQTPGPAETIAAATATFTAGSSETPEATPTLAAPTPSPSAVAPAATSGVSVTPTLVPTLAASPTRPPVTATPASPAVAAVSVVQTSTPAAVAPPQTAQAGERGWVWPAVIVIVLGVATAGIVLIRRQTA